MTSSKSTKRALLTSVLALVVCLAMLVGSTFAWFTDTATTGVNKIVSGNLKVGLEYWNGTKYADATNISLFSEETKWEPGHTEVVYLKVSNLGSLALKYRLRTIDTFEYQYAKNSKGEKILLSKYLEIGVAEGINAAEGTFANRDEAVKAAAGNMVDYKSYTKDSTILANADADYIALVVRMPETVGNEANWDSTVRGSYGAPWIRFSLALTATQASSESDSFDNKYDEKAPYPVAGKDAQQTGIALYYELENRNPSILLGADADRSFGWFVRYATTINLNGQKMTSTGNQSVIDVTAGGDLTVTGNGTVDASGGRDSITAVTVDNGGKLTIEGGTFLGKDGNSCIYNAGGTVEIKGGTFKGGADFTLNCYDEAYKNGSAKIVVTGGKFYKYDPSNSKSENPAANFVADGYKVVQDGDWYEVVAK